MDLPGTRAVVISPVDKGTPQEEAVAGDASYLILLAAIHKALKPRCYLEIGVGQGHSLALAKCPAIGVDPRPDLTVALGPQARVLTQTSDDFFDTTECDELGQPPDLAFIDGMHLFECALRDFMHIEALSSPTTLVVVDDILPNHPAQAERDRRTRVWTGDVWKLYDCLRRQRGDLILLPLNSAPTGLLLIAGLNAADTTLSDRYNPILRHYRDIIAPPKEVLERTGVLPGHPETVQSVAIALRTARDEGADRGAVLRCLHEVLPSAAGKCRKTKGR